jgi:hypothetical protein
MQQGGASVPGEFGFYVDAGSMAQHNGAVRAAIPDTLLSSARYQQDVDYSRWRREQDYRNSPLAETSLAELAPTLLECHIDSVNRARLNRAVVRLPLEGLSRLELSGWANTDLSNALGYQYVRGRDLLSSSPVYAMSAGLRRQDVARKKQASLLHSGFRSSSDISQLKRGNYTLESWFQIESEWYRCKGGISLGVY